MIRLQRFPILPILAAYEALLVAWVASLRVRFSGWEFKDQFKDMEWVQHIQEVHLGIATLAIAASASLAWRRDLRSWTPGLILILSGFLWATNRELDGMWEKFRLDLVYDSLKFVSLIPAVAVVWIYRRECFDSAAALWRRPEKRWILVGVAGYITGQLVGKLFEEMDWSRNYKRAIEESFELFSGPLFIVYALKTAAAVSAETRLDQDPSLTSSESA